MDIHTIESKTKTDFKITIRKVYKKSRKNI